MSSYVLVTVHQALSIRGNYRVGDKLEAHFTRVMVKCSAEVGRLIWRSGVGLRAGVVEVEVSGQVQVRSQALDYAWFFFFLLVHLSSIVFYFLFPNCSILCKIDIVEKEIEI